MGKDAYITARVSEEMQAEIRKIAQVERRSMSQVLMMLLESALVAKKAIKMSK